MASDAAKKLRAAMREEDYAEESGDEESSGTSAYADLGREIMDAMKADDAEGFSSALEEFVHLCMEGHEGMGGGMEGKGPSLAIVLGGKK